MQRNYKVTGLKPVASTVVFSFNNAVKLTWVHQAFQERFQEPYHRTPIGEKGGRERGREANGSDRKRGRGKRGRKMRRGLSVGSQSMTGRYK